MSPAGGALNSIVSAHVTQRRRRSFLPIIIGTTMIIAGVVGFRSASDLTNDVPSTDGVVVDSKFLPADGGRPLRGTSLVAVLTVEYLAQGEKRRLEASINTSSATGQVLYGEGQLVKVYLRKGPSGLNATLTKPRTLAQLWMWLGMAGVVVTLAAVLAKVAVRSNKSLERSRDR